MMLMERKARSSSFLAAPDLLPARAGGLSLVSCRSLDCFLAQAPKVES